MPNYDFGSLGTDLHPKADVAEQREGFWYAVEIYDRIRDVYFSDHAICELSLASGVFRKKHESGSSRF